MIIKIADNAGFCFGVKRAIRLTEEALAQGEVSTLGQLIHNKDETDRLKKLGVRQVEGPGELETKQVIIRSHGLSKRLKYDIIKKGYSLIDATCPVLMKIYEKIQEMEARGYDLVLVGDRDHPEIVAILGHLQDPERGHVVWTKEEAEKISLDKIYLISQTTNTQEKFKDISDIIESNNTHVLVRNTICHATKTRQEKAVELAKEVDAMLIVGGMNSSNTNKLYQMAKAVNDNTYRIENSRDLPLHEVLKYKKVGLSAGASTPDWIIEEVVNVMDNYSTEDFMEQVVDSMQKIYPREIVTGNVIYVTDDEVMVNIGYQADGIITRSELSSDSSKNPKDLFEEGDEIEVYIVKLDDGEGNVVLSTRRVEAMQTWKELVEAYENDQVVEAEITQAVKGGLLANIKGITAFMPGSHVADRYVKDLESFVGQTLEVKIINLDDRKRRLVISRKVILEAERQKELDKAWENIEVDKVMTGTVQRLTDFGAFVDLGGVDGLIHISDISWNRIGHPSEVLENGQEVEVLVLRANRERNRISLGYKQLQPKPFDEFLANNKVGDVVQGTVVNLVDFGAFVRLAEGVEGLVHISQIAHQHVEKPADILTIGDVVDVQILEINEEEKRIALSIKATLEAPERPQREEQPRRRPRKRKPRAQAPVQASSESLFDDSALNTDLGSLLDSAALELGLADVEVEEEVEAEAPAQAEEVEEAEVDVEAEAPSEAEASSEPEAEEEETEE